MTIVAKYNQEQAIQPQVITREERRDTLIIRCGYLITILIAIAFVILGVVGIIPTPYVVLGFFPLGFLALLEYIAWSCFN